MSNINNGRDSIKIIRKNIFLVYFLNVLINGLGQIIAEIKIEKINRTYVKNIC